MGERTEIPEFWREAIEEKKRVRYRSAREVTDRFIEPFRFEVRGGIEYVVAFCHLRRARRSFRLDRIINL